MIRCETVRKLAGREFCATRPEKKVVNGGGMRTGCSTGVYSSCQPTIVLEYRSLAPAHPGGPGKKGRKKVVVVVVAEASSFLFACREFVVISGVC